MKCAISSATRVLFVNQTGQVSGAEHSLLSLLDGLEGTVKRLVACPEGELVEQLESRGLDHLPITGTQVSFRMHPLHTTRGLLEVARSSLQIRRLVYRHSPDLVHANTTRASLLALLGRRHGGPPVVAHIRDRAAPGRPASAVFDIVGRRADAVVANSAYVGDQFDGVRLRRPVQVIYNPVDLARFDPRRADGRHIRSELEIAPQTTVLAVIAQLTALKGQDTAMRVVAELAASGRDVILLVVGSAKFASAGTQLSNVAFERDLRHLAAELDLGQRVRFLGERNDVPDVLAATDILLMPYLREGFGRIAIEAMAMEVPVVAASLGGPTEIVRAEDDGLLVPPGDTSAWVRELGSLVDRREARARLGAAGPARAADFSLAKHVDATLRLYAELLPAGTRQ